MTGHNITRGTVRRGYTLIEMLVVITAVGALSVMGAVLIGLLMSAATRGTEETVVQTTLSRLARQLRADVHAAESANVGAIDGRSDAGLTLNLPGGRSVSYAARDDSIVRETAAGEAAQHEEYRLPEGATRFVVDGETRMAGLVHERPFALPPDTGAEGLQPLPPRVLRIEAAVDWDRRHARRSETNDSGE